MKIGLSEIWDFSRLIGAEEEGWTFELVAGDLTISDLSQQVLSTLQADPEYDTELLPSIFTFREILWQPDVFTASHQSLPALRILKAYCDETMTSYEESESDTKALYARMLGGLSDCCEQAIGALELSGASVKAVLGTFRTNAFPIIKFFIYHPQNRTDYFQDAVNRLNYTVKIMLTQFHGKYTELSDPYWKVTYAAEGDIEKSPAKSVVDKEKS